MSGTNEVAAGAMLRHNRLPVSEPRRIHPERDPNEQPQDEDALRDQLHDIEVVQGWLDSLDEDE